MKTHVIWGWGRTWMGLLSRCCVNIPKCLGDCSASTKRQKVISLNLFGRS